MRLKLMDIVLILLIAIAALAILAFLLIKFQEHQTAMYERRLAAQAHLMNAARPVSAGSVTYVMRGIDRKGQVVYDTIPNTYLPLPMPAVPSEAHAEIVDPAHDLAVKLVKASIDYQGLELGGTHRVAHTHGAEGNQILTAEEALSAGVFGRRDDWQTAVNWLCERGCQRVNDKERNGIFSEKTLRDLMLALAFEALPKRQTTVIGKREWGE